MYFIHKFMISVILSAQIDSQDECADKKCIGNITLNPSLTSYPLTQ